MVTAQNVQDVRFSGAVNGYKKSEVDAFLDQCASTIENLTAEKEESARKMQVLAETIVEYRNQEDSIRTALLSAQRMSESIVAEAQEKSAALVAEAEEKAKSIEIESKRNIQDELDELARIQKEVSAFRAKLLATYREHLTLIGILNEDEKNAAPVSETPIEEDEVVEHAQPSEMPIFGDTATIQTRDVQIDISAFELQDEE